MNRAAALRDNGGSVAMTGHFKTMYVSALYL